MKQIHYSLAFLMAIVLWSCENKKADNTAEKSNDFKEISANMSESIAHRAIQLDKISDYFKEIPEKYIEIPLNRRNAVLNASSPDKSVTIVKGPQKVMRYFRGDLDEQNAYLMVYSINEDGFYELCYWNLPDGSRLLGINHQQGYDEATNESLPPQLTFLKYENNNWREVQGVIPTIKIKDFIPADFLKKYNLDGERTANLFYQLPKKGKDITVNFDAYADFSEKNFTYEVIESLPTQGILKWKEGKFVAGGFSVPK